MARLGLRTPRDSVYKHGPTRPTSERPLRLDPRVQGCSSDSAREHRKDPATKLPSAALRSTQLSAREHRPPTRPASGKGDHCHHYRGHPQGCCVKRAANLAFERLLRRFQKCGKSVMPNLPGQPGLESYDLCLGFGQGPI